MILRPGGLAVLAALASGCTTSYVAAIAPQTETDANTGSGSASSGPAESTDAEATGTSEGTGSSGDSGCAPPQPQPGCDRAADPLRAPEFSCYEDIAAARFESEAPNAWRRARELGNANWVSEESEAVLVLSTGVLPDVGLVGEVNVAAGAAQNASADNENPDAVSSLPAGIVPSPGAESDAPYVDCDGLGDCSGTLASAFGGSANDFIWLTFDATVPPDVHGYTVRVGFLSAEYPEAIGSENTDLFVWWHESEDYVGNLATWQDGAANVTGLASRMHEFAGEHPMLLRTGMAGRTGTLCDVAGQSVNCPIGAATGWMELRGPAVPGETVHLVAALFDQGPLDRDTIVVLDGFEWSCESCVPGESCGLR